MRLVLNVDRKNRLYCNFYDALIVIVSMTRFRSKFENILMNGYDIVDCCLLCFKENLDSLPNVSSSLLKERIAYVKIEHFLSLG